MPYSEEDHDRAFSRLLRDLDNHAEKEKPRRFEAGVGVLLSALCLLLVIWILLFVG